MASGLLLEAFLVLLGLILDCFGIPRAAQVASKAVNKITQMPLVAPMVGQVVPRRLTKAPQRTQK